ncbi:MAG: Ig-like domain-containing protein, partial [Cytophagales bacterium]|nr:Ig-like domain-containing protein [Cytophagales bacterium]
MLFLRCASQRSPTGGNKDTIAPVLIKAIPDNYSTEFNTDRFRLYFDEAVDGSQIANFLFVTPSIPETYKIKFSKNWIEIQLKEALKDSTTYTF